VSKRVQKSKLWLLLNISLLNRMMELAHRIDYKTKLVQFDFVSFFLIISSLLLLFLLSDIFTGKMSKVVLASVLENTLAIYIKTNCFEIYLYVFYGMILQVVVMIFIQNQSGISLTSVIGILFIILREIKSSFINYV
jgi:hypothetical protein